MKKFIKVFNEDDKSKLLDAGYTLISEDDGVTTFLNNSKISFNKEDVDHVSYTDILAL